MRQVFEGKLKTHEGKALPGETMKPAMQQAQKNETNKRCHACLSASCAMLKKIHQATWVIHVCK